MSSTRVTVAVAFSVAADGDDTPCSCDTVDITAHLNKMYKNDGITNVKKTSMENALARCVISYSTSAESVFRYLDVLDVTAKKNTRVMHIHTGPYRSGALPFLCRMFWRK
jgi:hypothetical protein